MASAPRVARLCAAVCRRAAPQLVRPRAVAAVSRRAAAVAFSTTAMRPAETDTDGDDGDWKPVELRQLEKAFSEQITPEGLQQLDAVAKASGHNSIEAYLDSKLADAPGRSLRDRTLGTELAIADNPKPEKNAFWFDEEDPDTNTEEHDTFDEDDMLDIAHAKLQEVREMRHYTRLAVWEMPLLSKLAKPFELPKADQVLRWRYTTYMGEPHSAESKVVVQFAPTDLGLTDVQASKLRKLAGARLDPTTDVIKMGCDRYEHQAQNKQYLLQLVNTLITEAKDPKDTFEDVALDTRHYHNATKADKKKPKFPTEWRMTAERQKQLAALRARAVLEETQKSDKGLLVDGQAKIDSYLMKKLSEESQKRVAEPVAVPAGRGPAARR